MNAVTGLSANEVEMAIADIEFADVFRDAIGNYLDELQEWIGPNGCAPNAALSQEVHKAQTLLIEVDSRLYNAKERLEKALKLAAAA